MWLTKPPQQTTLSIKEVPGKILSKTKDDVSTITHFTIQNNSGRFHWCSISSQKPAGIPLPPNHPTTAEKLDRLGVHEAAKQGLRLNPIEKMSPRTPGP